MLQVWGVLQLRHLIKEGLRINYGTAIQNHLVGELIARSVELQLAFECVDGDGLLVSGCRLSLAVTQGALGEVND